MQAFSIVSMKQVKSLVSYGSVFLWLTSVSTRLWGRTETPLALRAVVKFQDSLGMKETGEERIIGVMMGSWNVPLSQKENSKNEKWEGFW